jgi:mycothiol synthase
LSGPLPPRQPLHIGPLGSEQVARILGLVDAAAEADGIAPLSEATMLHVRHDKGSAGHTDVVLGNVSGYAHLEDPGPEGDLSGELVVHPSLRRRGYGRELLDALTRLAAGRGPRIWAHGDLPAAAALARSAGFTRVRALWQMRRPLLDAPLGRVTLPSGVTLRSFAPGNDEDAWLEVNRRAFAKHPEQGSWTLEDLRLREAEPWFDPDGFILAERDGHLAGFHWTKIHPGSVGEVYVVGVDPAEQGSGLGRALTLAGLEYLASRNLSQVMLYVDEDNHPAVRMYESLGFSRWSTDVMYAPARGDRPAE